MFLQYTENLAKKIDVRSSSMCLAVGRGFSPGPLVSSTNKTDRHDITEKLLKVA
jgi:hypothetical protein